MGESQFQAEWVEIIDADGARAFRGSQSEYESWQEAKMKRGIYIGKLRKEARYTPKERAWIDFMAGLGTDAFRSAPVIGFDPTINKAEAFRCPQPEVYERATRLLAQYDEQYQKIMRPARARVGPARAKLKEMGLDE